MRIMHLVLLAALLAMISTATAQVSFEAAAGSIQEKLNSAGQELSEKAAQHYLEGNMTREHISQDINAKKQKLEEEARARIDQEINENLNLAPDQLQQKAEEEIKKRVLGEVQQQPGFELHLAVLATLAAACLVRRRDS